MELVSAKGVFLECILGQVAMEPPESPKGPNGGGECCAPLDKCDRTKDGPSQGVLRAQDRSRHADCTEPKLMVIEDCMHNLVSI